MRAALALIFGAFCFILSVAAPSSGAEKLRVAYPTLSQFFHPARESLFSELRRELACFLFRSALHHAFPRLGAPVFCGSSSTSISGSLRL